MPVKKPKRRSIHPVGDENEKIRHPYGNTAFKKKTVIPVLFKSQYDNDHHVYKDKLRKSNPLSFTAASANDKVSGADTTNNQEVKRNAFSEKLIEGILYLFNKGSLHGLKYVTDSTKTLKERFLWAIICLTSFALCVYNIYSLWFNWYSSPFNIVLDDRYTPIFDIPFPHVTICPKNTLKLSVLDLTKVTDKSLLFVASLLCAGMDSAKYSLPEKMSPEHETLLTKFFENSTPTCSETIKACRWMSQDGIVEEYTEDCCSTLFHPVLTNNGVCFGFNMMTSLPKNEMVEILERHETFSWTPRDGYPPYVFAGNNFAYPRRVFNNGEKFGLWVELYVNSSESQDMCDGSELGFKVIVDSPMESVLTSNFAKIPMERQTSFAVRPSKVTTDPDMKKLTPENRKCFFNEEMKLKFFMFYTQANCLLECEIKYISSICHCAPFYFKELLPNVTTCSSNAEYLCIKEVKADMNIRNVEEYYGWKKKVKAPIQSAQMLRSDRIVACYCYPSCEDISYNLEVFYADLTRSPTQIPHWSKVMTQRNEITRLGIHFKDTLFFGTHRQMRYSDMDFLASCGGVLGLFMGFSIVSIFELVYYVFIKPVILAVFVKLEFRSKKDAAPPQYYEWNN